MRALSRPLLWIRQLDAIPRQPVAQVRARPDHASSSTATATAAMNASVSTPDMRHMVRLEKLSAG
jgi:hypothetical protein